MLHRLHNILTAAAVALCDAVENVTSETTGLNQSDTAALLMITQWPGGSLQSFANALALSQPATVRLVDRLEEAGLVTRKSGSGGHVLGLFPTAEGKKMASRALSARRQLLSSLMDDIVSSATSTEAKVLEKFAESILERRTVSASDGDRICRLCADCDCPNESCPVWKKQMKDPAYQWRGWK